MKLDLSKATIYEIFPRNHSAEGTFDAIIKDLDRIAALGVDFIWLMPFYPVGELNRKGSLGSPYAIRDYRSIDPNIGTLESFRNLANEIHRRNMRLMIDIVYNHTAPDSVLRADHPEWFLKDTMGGFTTKEPDWTDVIDLKYRGKEMKNYQLETLEFWSKNGVDGFRCDVAPMVPLKFWKAARKRIRKKTKNFVWLAESVHKSYVKTIRDRGYKCHADPELHRYV